MNQHKENVSISVNNPVTVRNQYIVISIVKGLGLPYRRNLIFTVYYVCNKDLGLFVKFTSSYGVIELLLSKGVMDSKHFMDD